MQRYILQPYLLLALLGFFCFVNFAIVRNKLIEPSLAMAVEDRVVISAPVLTLLYGADVHLAANLENIRLAATSFNYYINEMDISYLGRAHKVVTNLNPCHEDNYYWANAFLTNSGAVNDGNNILAQASNCRFWDGVPAFLYGVNEVFYNNNIAEAIKALTVAAKRWEINKIAINNFIISLRSLQFDDAEQALAFLQHEHDSAKDERAKKGLERRMARIKTLVDLRKAQKEYEAQFGKLEYIEQLVEQQIIAELPEDPLFLGFELKNGRIELKQVSWAKK